MSGSLPKGWENTTLDTVGVWYGGGTPSKAERRYWKDGTIPWISPKDMKVLRIEDSEDHITQAAAQRTHAALFPAGTILIVVRSGILSRTLPVAVNTVPATMNQDLKGLFPATGIDPMYVAYYLMGNERALLARCSKAGTTVASIEVPRLKDFRLLLAPTNEQHRIVAKIEELFSHLDAAVSALERAQANLARYRASVLKAAVEGKLTAGWRKKNPDVEPAFKLLERILAERRKKWEEAELAKYAARGRTLPKGWKEKYKEPAAPDTSRLPTLPEGWCWASWNQIGFSQNGRAFPSSEYTESGTKLLRPGNLHASGRVDWTDANTRSMPEKWAKDFPLFVVGPGELVVNLTAQSLKDEFLGRVCLTGNNERCLLNQRIARLTPIGVSRQFILWLLKSRVFRRFVDKLNTGSLIQHMFTSQLDKFIFPLPSTEEQAQLVVEIEDRMSTIENLESLCESNTHRSARMRNGVLKWAFEGKLIPQDPNDEPASRLLERIKAEKQASQPECKPKRLSRTARKSK